MPARRTASSTRTDRAAVQMSNDTTLRRMSAVFFASSEALCDWLDANHATAAELWVGIYKKGVDRAGVTLAEAQDIAMRFGWVDSMSRRIVPRSGTGAAF